ncbi:MAG: SDR family oxidoreductase [Myxococcota bacterium]
MTHPKRLLVFGATGGTGRHLVAQALAAGHTVTAFVRDAGRLEPHPRLRIALGDAVTQPEEVAAAVPGHDVVLCSIGAPALKAAGTRARATANIVAAMQAAGVRRLVIQSTFGVGETWAHLPMIMRYAVVPLYLARTFADHEAQERIVRASGLDWTIARPPHLHDGARTATRVGFAPDDRSVRMNIARADVAAFLLSQVDDDRWLHQAPAIAS